MHGLKSGDLMKNVTLRSGWVIVASIISSTYLIPAYIEWRAVSRMSSYKGPFRHVATNSVTQPGWSQLRFSIDMQCAIYCRNATPTFIDIQTFLYRNEYTWHFVIIDCYLTYTVLLGFLIRTNQIRIYNEASCKLVSPLHRTNCTFFPYSRMLLIKSVVEGSEYVKTIIIRDICNCMVPASTELVWFMKTNTKIVISPHR